MDLLINLCIRLACIQKLLVSLILCSRSGFSDDALLYKGRLLRRKLEEVEAEKTQLHAEVSAVRSKNKAAEVDRHKLVLAQQSEAASTHMQVKPPHI